MKRLHVHVAVEDLAQSRAFYSTLFGVEPTVLEADYAKWMLDDPKVNFAISKRGRTGGIDHLGIQVESADELAEITGRLKAAEQRVATADQAPCCYAISDKTWAADPQGVRWESFLTHGQITTYGEGTSAELICELPPEPAACCEANAAAPAGCSLSESEFAARIVEIVVLNRRALRHARRDGNMIILTYDAALAADVEALIERERICCAGLSFSITRNAGELSLTIEVPQDRSDEAERVFEAFAAKGAPAAACC
jgi:catechol 2,3-dioxygenase-like lactoylglutathione lyase family enzyme